MQERPETGAGATGEAIADANPFPGPRPFTESEGWLFFGRERELSDLVALLFAQRAVLLHGPSGGGKSSLMHAGLVPRARGRGFDFLPVARVRHTTLQRDEGLAGNRYMGNVIDNWRDAGLDVPPGATTLAEVLRSLPPAEEPGRVVVFDQFEEIFVVHPESWKDRTDLLLQVQAALDDDPLLHVVFILRDDYLARLQPLTTVLRDRLGTRYHLRGLSTAQALDAVVRPFAATGRTFGTGVAEDLVTALREQPAVAPDTRSYEGEDVEPVQLQIVCRTFFDRLPRDVVEIGAVDIDRHADVGQALVGFYEQAVGAAIKGHPGIRERRVRLWFERQLITPARTRGIVFRDQRTTAGLANEVVDELEQRRVVRSEPRGPATWYELPHDRLVDAILASNRLWYASRSRTVARLSAVVGVLGVLMAAVSLVLLNRESSTDSAPDPEQYEISVSGQAVTRQISARGGQQVTAIMTPDDQLTGELRLLDSQGTLLGQSSGIGSSQLLLTLPVPADGEYQLQARGQGASTGGFQLAYSVRTVDVVEAPLNAGQPVPGEIGEPDEVDVYTFTGPPGAVAQVSMAAEDALRPVLVLTGPGSSGIVDRGYSEAVLAFVIPQDGEYEVRASSLGEETGPYRLDLELLDAGGTQGRVTGTLDARNRVDVRAIRSEAGGVVGLSYEGGEAGNVRLLAADGRTLVAEYVEGQGGAIEPWPIAPATTYLVMVTWSGNPTPYSLSITLEDARPLMGGRAEGEISRPEQLVAYRFDGQQGEMTVLVTTPQADLDLAVAVVQPDGTVLIQTDGAGAGDDELFTVRLRVSGPHLLVIGSAVPTQTGRFAVAVTQGG